MSKYSCKSCAALAVAVAIGFCFGILYHGPENASAHSDDQAGGEHLHYADQSTFTIDSGTAYIQCHFNSQPIDLRSFTWRVDQIAAKSIQLCGDPK